MISQEKLSAFLDGELEGPEQEAVRSEIASNEILAAQLDRFERADKQLKEACGQIDDKPIPNATHRLLDTGRTELNNSGRTGSKRSRVLYQAVAASVVLASLLGLAVQYWIPKDTAGNSSQLNLGPVAQDSKLHRALELMSSGSRLILTSSSEVTITPLLSFLSSQQQYCREFTYSSDIAAYVGVACRTGGGWNVLSVGRVQSHEKASGGYFTATADSAQGHDSYVRNLMRQDPMSKEEERALLENSWEKNH